MALRVFNTSFRCIAEQYQLRCDVNYRFFYDILKANVWANSSLRLRDVMSLVVSEKVIKGELPDEKLLVDLCNIKRRFDTLSGTQFVSEIGSDKSLIETGDIIIPKIQPRLGNIFTNISHERYIGSTELVEYRLTGRIHPKILFYLLVSRQFSDCLSLTESGKTHRRVQPIDLLNYRIPNISGDIQGSLVRKIEKFEKEIKDLQEHLIPTADIINDAFKQELCLETTALEGIERLKVLKKQFCDLSSCNTGLRSSIRWCKLLEVKKVLSEMYGEKYALLDSFLIGNKTRNGWSPENSEFEGSTKILGIDAINYDGILTTDYPKYTDEYRDDMSQFIIREGDFFVSRGNTVDLVALASIAPELNDEYIYPDIMIKLSIDESRLNKKYLAYCFNSFWGRSYFRYASKGKQQTMVKVSAEEIRQFPIPYIPIEEQEAIVNIIMNGIEKQNALNDKINYLRDQIDKTISEAVMSM